jgi:uncharacterized protein with PIN domain
MTYGGSMPRRYTALIYDAENGDGWVCSACFEKSVDPEHRAMAYLTAHPGKVHGDARCMLCGNRVDSVAAQAAAKRIADILTPMAGRSATTCPGE